VVFVKVHYGYPDSIDPDNNTVMEYRAPEQARVLTINENLEGEGVLPGFRYPLKQLFR